MKTLTFNTEDMLVNENKGLQGYEMMANAILCMLIDECKTDIELRDAMRRDTGNTDSMEGCVKYICEAIQEGQENQRCIMVEDRKVLDLAIEYFKNNQNEQDND